MAEYSDARSRGGGRSFRSAPRQKAPVTKKQQPAGQQKPGMSRGLMGGLLGGALGGMLLGSMFGMGGSGMGILPLLLLGVVGYFLYKRFSARPPSGTPPGYQPPPQNNNVFKGNFGGNDSGAQGGFTPPPNHLLNPILKKDWMLFVSVIPLLIRSTLSKWHRMCFLRFRPVGCVAISAPISIF